MACSCDTAALQLRLAGPRQANPGKFVDILADQAFVDRGGQRLDFDLYRPADFAKGGRPIVILVHGGFWSLGQRSDMAEWAYDLAAHGYLAATIGYRLVGNGVTFPLPVGDVLAAIRFFHEHAIDYGGDSNRIAVFGLSAGANLAMLAGLTSDASVFDPDLSQGQTIPVAAIVDLFGRADLTVYTENSPPEEVFVIEQYLGTRIDQAGDLLRTASPVNYVRSDGPPVLIIHGDADTLIPVTQSRRLHDALNAASQPNEYLEVSGMDHLSGAIWQGQFAQGYRPKVLEFLSERLGN